MCILLHCATSPSHNRGVNRQGSECICPAVLAISTKKGAIFPIKSHFAKSTAHYSNLDSFQEVINGLTGKVRHPCMKYTKSHYRPAGKLSPWTSPQVLWFSGSHVRVKYQPSHFTQYKYLLSTCAVLRLLLGKEAYSWDSSQPSGVNRLDEESIYTTHAVTSCQAKKWSARNPETKVCITLKQRYV